MKKIWIVYATGLVLSLGYGCATRQYVNSSIAPLDDRISKLEKAGSSSLDAALKRAQDAADRAEAAAKKSENAMKKANEAEAKADAAAQKADAAEKKAETAAHKSAKEFELIQKK